MTELVFDDNDLVGSFEADKPLAVYPAFGSPAYEAASFDSSEMALWHSPLQSVDMDILPEMGVVTPRVRDLARNDAVVSGAIRSRSDSIVGERFLVNSIPNATVLGLDEVWAEEFQEEVEAKFTQYAESLLCYPDAQRKNTLTELVRLAVGTYSLTGEVLASVEWLRDSGRPYSTALQLIENERLSNPNQEMDSRLLRGGVQRNQFGAAVGYYIRNAFPTDFLDFDNVNQWSYVPATKWWGRLQMVHIIDQIRPDQTRGISRLVSALKEMRQLKKFRDISLQSAALQASIAASIESELPPDTVFAQMGSGDIQAVANYSRGYLKEIAKFTKGSKNLMVNGARIPHFYPGTKLNLNTMGTPGGLGTTFEESMMRYISVALNASYEEISHDYSKGNYSNLRAALAETEKGRQVEKKRCADRFASIFFRLWMEEAINKGEITSMPRNAPNWYDGMNSDAYSECSWIGANKGQIDGLKESQAAILRMNNGLATGEDELAAMGKDWRQVYRQLAREQRFRKKIGLELNAAASQNMMNAVGGSPSEDGGKPKGEEGSDE